MVVTRRCVAALLVIATACARSSSSSAGGEPPRTDTGLRVARNPNVITAEELHDPMVISMDALKAIRYLRPAFFRTTGPQSFSDPSAGLVQISPDFGPPQPLNHLSSFTTIVLFEVRYLDANEAHARFGLRANGGPVIVLLSSKQ